MKDPWKTAQSTKLVGRMTAFAVVLGLAAVVPESARAASGLEKLKSTGVVTVAVAHEPPFTIYEPSGEVTGAAPEVLRLSYTTPCCGLGSFSIRHYIYLLTIWIPFP